MSIPIEDYALISNSRTGALVSRRGAIDWLCLPRYDSASIFAALLGDAEHGTWHLHPTDEVAVATRRYDGETMTLVTRWETATGIVDVYDFMPIASGAASVVRHIVGVQGSVEFVTSFRLRFDYARAVPWVRQVGEGETPGLLALCGPDAVLITGVQLRATETVHAATFTVAAEQTRDLVLRWFPSWHDLPDPLDVPAARESTRRWWQDWADRIVDDGPHHHHVVRSLLLLRALSHEDTGGIVAAATTSLPEDFGGERNWDYRYVWLRDAALTLEALIDHGFLGVAGRWREWLLRAVAGRPADVQIMYGLAGERHLPEQELDSLPGYENSRPVRIGNGAVDQFQADVIGEVMVALEAVRDAGVEETNFSWALQRSLLAQVVDTIDRPDHGIWEMRGELQMFTHSRVMVWAALDRGVRAVRDRGFPGDADLWERLRDQVRDEIDAHGYDASRGHFVQYPGTAEVDASLLLLPQVGYCAADDPRMMRTVEEMEHTLLRDGLLLRYRANGIDGLSGGEHPFLACSFWLVEQYAASGRVQDAKALMERLCGLANDVGMLAEQYDVGAERHAGNTPQALSHLALVRAADALAGHFGRAASRT